MEEKFKKDLDRFKTLSYEDFKTLANDDSLSVYQKIGFPDEYRKEKEKEIFKDIIQKLDLENQKNKTILDIGPGCSDLANYIINFSIENKHTLLLADSKEMLDLLPNNDNIQKFEGYFPDQTNTLIEKYTQKVDYIICYSIFHYVFYNTCIFKFLDIAVSMLNDGGKIIIADIPNISKRKRFFSTETGIKSHQEYTNTNTQPNIEHLILEPTQIDDAVIFSILQRYRNFGCETYLMPQPKTLPMWNRREDILIEKF